MDYIGNVVITDNSRVNLDKTFKRCNTLVDTIPQLPTLIIGYQNYIKKMVSRAEFVLDFWKNREKI